MVGQSTFDTKFGADFLGDVPLSPGVYLFHDKKGEVIYVGKAKSLRRRLRNYRNATAKKAHRKMRRLVKEAFSVEVRPLESEQEALLTENRLIQELKPRFNVDGAYAFLYPAIGVGSKDKLTLLCFTTDPASYSALDLSWYGTFRSRPRAKEAFDSLVELLSLLGHIEKRNRVYADPLPRGTRLVGLRQIPIDISEALPWFFAGEEPELLGTMARSLLQKPRARREAEDVQEKLLCLKHFFERDARRLRDALRGLGRAGSFISQEQRDALFIEAAFNPEQ